MAPVSERPAVVVLGLSLAGLNAMRNLTRRGIQVIGVDADSRQAGFHSCASEAVLVASPDEEPQRVVEQVTAIGRRLGGRPVLLPATDSFALWLARYQDPLAAQFRFTVAEPALVEALVDKAAFAQLMSRHDLPTPRTWRLNGRHEPSHELRYPCAVKPAVSHQFHRRVNRKGFYVTSPAALAALQQHLNGAGDALIAQEFVPGSDATHFSCAAYLDAAGTARGVFVSRKIRQYPRRLGVGSLCESAWDEEVAALGLRVLRAIGFRGLAEVEVKRNAVDGRLYILEINARTWLQNQLAARCGVDLDYAAYAEHADSSWTAPRQVDGIKWISLRGDVRSAAQALRARELTVSQWLGSLRGPIELAYWSWRDPMPFVHELGRMARDVVGAAGRLIRRREG